MSVIKWMTGRHPGMTDAPRADSLLLQADYRALDPHLVSLNTGAAAYIFASASPSACHFDQIHHQSASTLPVLFSDRRAWLPVAQKCLRGSPLLSFVLYMHQPAL